MEEKCECKEIEEYKKTIPLCPHKGCRYWNPDLHTCNTWFYAYGNCKRFITSPKIVYNGTLEELKEIPDLYEEQNKGVKK